MAKEAKKRPVDSPVEAESTRKRRRKIPEEQKKLERVIRATTLDSDLLNNVCSKRIKTDKVPQGISLTLAKETDKRMKRSSCIYPKESKVQVVEDAAKRRKQIIPKNKVKIVEELNSLPIKKEANLNYTRKTPVENAKKKKEDRKETESNKDNQAKQPNKVEDAAKRRKQIIPKNKVKIVEELNSLPIKKEANLNYTRKTPVENAKKKKEDRKETESNKDNQAKQPKRRPSSQAKKDASKGGNKNLKVKESKKEAVHQIASTCSTPQKKELLVKKATPIKAAPSTPSKTPVAQDSHSDSDESDWEEVEDLSTGQEPEVKSSQLPAEPVTITLEAPSIMSQKRKKCQFDMADYIRKQINRAEKEVQVEMHKTHLLCLLSHGFHRNRLCSDDDLKALGLSVVPLRYQEKDPIYWDAHYLNHLTKWFHTTFTIGPDVSENYGDIKGTLTMRFATKVLASEDELVFIYVIILRSLGAQVRLVSSLQPVSHKCPQRLKKPKKDGDQETEVKKDVEKPPEPFQAKQIEDPGDTSVMDLIRRMECSGRSPVDPGHPREENKTKSEAAKKQASSQKVKNNRQRSHASKVNNVNTENSTYKKRRSSKEGKTKTKDMESNPEVIDVESDSDFEPGTSNWKHPPVKKRRKSKEKAKVVSSDSDDVEVVKVVTNDKGTDYWTEVYLERAEGWIPVDCARCRVNHSSELEARATQPVCYVLAYGNENSIKDVTSRYASGWMSSVRKLRKDDVWWEEVLNPFKPRNKARDEAENKRLETQQMKKPLPTSVGEFKNHPLYVLKRHLLKFEAIYPPNAVPVGFIKGEPVYSRECVHLLHTRESWVKEGRAVRVKEKPYKFVKARKKRSRKSFETPGGKPEEEMAECFGHWQTEQYMPPPVYNGKVPRNEYGNVEVFQPWMIPPGAVHLRLPGLNKIAKKLNIDCAAAMTGWDFHGGYNHPVLDGFIVCEEHKDLLIAAWDEQQEIEKEKAAEKREKRALGNWKLMVRGLLIRERMKKRFDLVEPKVTAESSSSQSSKPGKAASDVTLAWPANRPDMVQKLSTAGQATLFPSEEI